MACIFLIRKSYEDFNYNMPPRAFDEIQTLLCCLLGGSYRPLYLYIIILAFSEPKPNVCIDGLNASPKKSVKLTFHVLVPKAYWEWDSTSAMFIQFGHPKLGPWTDCGTFQEVRYDQSHTAMC
jgi:hypothetical protein